MIYMNNMKCYNSSLNYNYLIRLYQTTYFDIQHHLTKLDEVRTSNHLDIAVTAHLLQI